MDELEVHKQDKSLKAFVNRMELRINHINKVNIELNQQIGINTVELKELEAEHELLCNIINQMEDARRLTI